MEVKSILEVAFEWFCECGAFEQLRKQSKCYSADSTVSHGVVKTVKTIMQSWISWNCSKQKQVEEYFCEKEMHKYMLLLLD